jgi:zinc transporter ZupT
MQVGFLVFFSLNAVFHFWWNYSLLVPCFVTGLLGGAVYVNAFTLIAKNVAPERVELALTTASLGDSMGAFPLSVTAPLVSTANASLTTLSQESFSAMLPASSFRRAFTKLTKSMGAL